MIWNGIEAIEARHRRKGPVSVLVLALVAGVLAACSGSGGPKLVYGDKNTVSYNYNWRIPNAQAAAYCERFGAKAEHVSSSPVQPGSPGFIHYFNCVGGKK